MSTKFTKAFELKNLMMTAAVGALMLPSIGWSAADGRGHNGPDLAPTSIPVALDRGIRSGQVEEALKVCYATGDSKTGVVSLLQRLANQLTAGQANSSEYFYSGYVSEGSDSTLNRNEFSVTGSIYGLIDAGRLGPNYLNTHSSPDTVKFVPRFQYSVDYAPDYIVELAVPVPLPRVKYQSVAQDTGYDEYGRMIQSERILMGVTINFQPAAYGTSVRLVNSQTRVKSAISINTVEYVECLKNELQKRAE